MIPGWKCPLTYQTGGGISAILLLTAALSFVGCGTKEPVLPAIGQPAPDFTFVDLDTDQKKNLSQLKGKIVVIDFWASWCAPCQETMAEMETYREKHPDWGNAVVLLAVSIDDTEAAAKSHLEKRGWNKTQNAWLDPDRGKNPDVLAYAGDGIPAGYIIGPDGVLFDAGHPAKLDVANAVKTLLQSTTR